MGIIGLIALLVFMALGMPIALCMGLIGFIGLAATTTMEAGLFRVGTAFWTMTANYTLACLPFFILMGYFAAVSGLTADAYNGARKWLARLPGGLAMTTIWGCAGFAACTSSSLACCITMANIALPEMRQHGYDDKLITGSIASGGTLGPLIPPSGIFVIYGILTEESIGKLFFAGIFPGILLATLYMITIWIWCKINPKLGPPGPKTSWREKLVSIKDLWGILLLFLVVMGGIYSGVFTPTEAASGGALAALLMALARGRLTKANIVEGFKDTFRTVGMVYPLIIGATLFGYFMAASGVGQALASFVSGLNLPTTAILIFIMLVFIILGTAMETMPMMILLVPILLPCLVTMGVDLIWFGVMMALMVEMGTISPPTGMNQFVMSSVARVPLTTVWVGVLPFCGSVCVCVAFLLAFPQIALFLPYTMR